MRGRSLVVAGLGAQVIGVSTQALWHVLLAGDETGLLTEDRTFLVDHTISNLGVASMVVGAWQLRRFRPGVPARVVLAGTALEVLGAVGDMIGHVRGGESIAAFALIGTGFLLATGGLLADIRQQRRHTAQVAPAGSHDSFGSSSMTGGLVDDDR